MPTNPLRPPGEPPLTLFRLCWRDRTTLEEWCEPEVWTRPVALRLSANPAAGWRRRYDCWLEPVRPAEGY
jgi:hypothetical protein